MKAILVSGGAVLVSVIWAGLFWFIQLEASTPKIIKRPKRKQSSASLH